MRSVKSKFADILMYEWDDTKPAVIKMHSNIKHEQNDYGRIEFSGAWSNFSRVKQKKRKTNLGPKTCIHMNCERKHATLP